MIAIFDNNLPLSLARQMGQLQTGVAVSHIVELGLQDRSDASLRRRWKHDEVIWITRDEDFWMRRRLGPWFGFSSTIRGLCFCVRSWLRQSREACPNSAPAPAFWSAGNGWH
jgi:hypothetical protein